MTDEQKQKAQKFLNAYGELVKEHQQDFATYPVFIPDGQGGFKIVVQSTPVDISKMKDTPIESTLIAKE